MRKNKIAIIVAVCSIIVGCVLCVGAFVLNNNRFPNGKVGIISLGEGDLVKKTMEIDSKFRNIDIEDLPSMNVKICKSDINKCYVEYYDSDNMRHSIDVSNDTLSISVEKKKGSINISFISFCPETTVYLTEKEYDRINVVASSGDIDIDYDVIADELQLKASSGSICANNVSGNNASIIASSGIIKVNGASFADIEVETSSGDIELNNSEIDSIYAKSTSGDIDYSGVKANTIRFATTSGSTSGYSVLAKESIEGSASSGDIEFESASSLLFDLKTSSGDIELLLTADNKYAFETKTNSGDIEVPSYVPDANALCKLKTSSGDIEVN